MPPKKQLPQPIDRPLSRAMLRDFRGWSTAFPPGLSEPNSLRKMENVLINRDGSARIRPGLRYLSYSVVPEYDPVDDEVIVVPGVAMTESPVSSHEAFYLADGSRAYLFAVREDDDTVGFRVFSGVVHDLAWAGFTFEPSEAALNFTAATRYVKFLQIDNKVFALSDAGESMREFFVGATKRAKVLTSITRPEWTVTDKLTVVHPDAGWITAGEPTSIRKNLVRAPSFEVDVGDSGIPSFVGTGFGERSTDFARSGDYSLKMSSMPARINYMKQPLEDVNTSGDQNWYESTNANMSIHAGSNSLEWIIATAASPGGPEGEDMKGWLAGPIFGVYDLEALRPSVNVVAASNVRKMGYKAVYYNDALVQVGATQIFYGSAPALGRKVFSNSTVPAGATKVRLYFSITRDNGAAATWARINEVIVLDYYDGNSYFDGDTGANYFWEGAVSNSRSVYHPPQDIDYYTEIDAANTNTHTASVYVRAGTTARNVVLSFDTTDDAPVADVAGAWTRLDLSAAPGAPGTNSVRVTFEDVPRGEYHYIDDVMVEEVAVLDDYFDGATTPVVGTLYDWDGDAHLSTSTERVYAAPVIIPTAETKTGDTLISNVSAENQYSFGFFYTFNNEIGESAASQATVIQAQRPWSGWKWSPGNAAGEPDATQPDVVDPALAADQLVAIIPEEVFTAALAQGAIQANFYMFTWSDQDPVPVSAVKVGVRTLTPDSDYDAVGWFQVTPAQSDYGTATAVLPTLANRYNFSDPSKGGNGIVAADRMVLVKDPTAPAVIRWTSNQQGSYTDFSANKGGGYKTLTSGNLQIPACVKLWQNPQSADTLTVLCLGTDGHSTGYYMAPAQIASQSEATNIMAFEETTASPGTTSPYGCEVVNNSLYHPLDEHLLKSTASNYNINHKAVTDQIQESWRNLRTKEWIVSAVHDNRIYLIVNNPDGEELEDRCLGNEIWVFDAQAEAGNWSRLLIQAVSLRKLEQGGDVRMSVVRPDGIFYLDEDYALDDYVVDGDVLQRSIPWYLETNTQGANRAHDAWCHLQQLEITVGNFTGYMRYGILGWDRHGKAVAYEKDMKDLGERDGLPWDIQDQLQVKREMKEWFFYAGSRLEADGETVLPSEGKVALVTYRYAPISVNVGYEYGSIETFEYGRTQVNTGTELTNNGVPVPFNDQRRP